MSTSMWDKVIFLVVLLSGLGFLVTHPSGNFETAGLVVVAGGLMGLLSAHALAPVMTILEKAMGSGFLGNSSSGSSSAQAQQSSQSL